MDGEAPDTYVWLISARDACPACGAALAGAARCAACGRSLLARVFRPRSAITRALIGAWAIGALGAVLIITGVVFQLTGITTMVNPLPLLRAALAGAAGLLVLCALMAWGCATRRLWAVYAGLALAATLALMAMGGGAWLGGPLGLALATGGLLGGIALLFMHVSVLGEFRGELRQQLFAPTATSARGLAREGRAFLLAGLPFLAAQCWARAIGAEPGNAEYMHALGLALARLGQHERALAQLARALSIEPDNNEFQRSYAVVRGRAGAQ